MNKNNINKRIDVIKTKEDFNDIKTILCRYKSISDRVSKLEINFGSAISINFNKPIEIGNNSESIKRNLKQIVSDYNVFYEIFYQIKSLNIKEIINLFK